MDEQTIVPAVVTPVSSPAPAIEEKTNKPDFDPEQFEADILAKVEAQMPQIVEQVSKKTREEIISKIVGEEKKDERDERYVPESYEELMERTVKMAKEAIKQEQLEDKIKADADKKTAESTVQKTVEANDKYWDNQLAELEKSEVIGEMPEEIAEKLAAGKELTEEDRLHPSVVARAELYSKSRELKEAGDPDWWNLKYVAYRYGVGVPPRGANAPVFSRGGFSADSAKTGYTYEDIHNKSLQEIAKGG